MHTLEPVDGISRAHWPLPRLTRLYGYLKPAKSEIRQVFRL